MFIVVAITLAIWSFGSQRKGLCSFILKIYTFCTSSLDNEQKIFFTQVSIHFMSVLKCVHSPHIHKSDFCSDPHFSGEGGTIYSTGFFLFSQFWPTDISIVENCEWYH